MHTHRNEPAQQVSTKFELVRESRFITITNEGESAIFVTLDPESQEATKQDFRIAQGREFKYGGPLQGVQPLKHFFYIADGPGSIISVYAH